MLSILIPTYNYNITRLVNDLHQQAMVLSVDFEIIILEDGSTKLLEENKKIAQLSFVKYEISDKNIGRSAIRNRLAAMAQYSTLLFMDCDAEVCSPHFIEKYIPFCKETCVVIGGTAYDATDETPEYSLRLKYGREREARLPTEREAYNSFSTFNFLISATVFQSVKFDESLKGYGNEDTLFGYQLRKMNVTCYQIDNPLIHKGLDDNKTYLAKTKDAARNLLRLHRTGKYPFMIEESTLLGTYVKIKRLKSVRLMAFLFAISQNCLEQNLCGKNPSLTLYDFYKLGLMCQLSLQK